jgi:hypothetical protein
LGTPNADAGSHFAAWFESLDADDCIQRERQELADIVEKLDVDRRWSVLEV